MFGLTEKLRGNAAKAIGPGETVRASAIVTNSSQTRNTALVATERNLYAFTLKWPGQSRIGKQVFVHPIDEVQVEVAIKGVTWGGVHGAVRLVRQADGSVIETWRRYQARDYQELLAAVND
jgi:hypothetical protein